TSYAAYPEPPASATSLAEFNATGPAPVGGATANPPAPEESAPGTRTSSKEPLPGTYCPAERTPPRSPAAVGASASDPASISGMKTRALAGKLEYFTRKRVPVSAPAARTSNADAKPSVTRVEAKLVPAAKRLGRSMGEGRGEP